MWDVIRRVLAKGGDINDGAQLDAALQENLTVPSVYGGDATHRGYLHPRPDDPLGDQAPDGRLRATRTRRSRRWPTSASVARTTRPPESCEPTIEGPASAGSRTRSSRSPHDPRGELHVGRRQPAHGQRHHQRRGLRPARRRLRVDPRRHRPLPLRLQPSPTPSPPTSCSGSAIGPACRAGSPPSSESSRLWSSASASSASSTGPSPAGPAPPRCSRSSWRRSASPSPART